MPGNQISKGHLYPGNAGTRPVPKSSFLTSFQEVFIRTIVEIVLLLFVIDTSLRSKQ